MSDRFSQAWAKDWTRRRPVTHLETRAMTNKWIAVALPAMLITTAFQADLAAQGRRRQAKSQEQLASQRDDKLAEDWVKKGNWVTDWDKAQADAKKSGELIFAYFTRSYSP